MTARQKKAALKKISTFLIVEELKRRGMAVCIDCEAVFAETREDLFWLQNEIASLDNDEVGEDAGIFAEIADKLQDIVCFIDEKTDTTVKDENAKSTDYDGTFEELDNKMNETIALFTCNLMACKDEANREQMKKYDLRAKQIIWRVLMNQSIDVFVKTQIH